MFENSGYITPDTQQERPPRAPAEDSESGPPSPGLSPELIQAGIAAQLTESSLSLTEAEQPQPEVPMRASEQTSNLSPEFTKLVVDHRRAGNTELTVALCSHTAENSAAIARALKDCDILAFEGPGTGDEAHQRELEKIYTRLLSSDADPEWVDTELTAGVREEYTISCVLDHFRGTDKEVRLLDVSGEQKELLPDWKQALFDFFDSVEGLAPLEESRAACLKYVRDAAISYRFRDEYMSTRLKEVVDEVGQRQEPVSIGVMVGMTHWSAIDAVSEVADATAGERALETIQRTIRANDWAMIAGAAGDYEMMAEYTDRTLLLGYLTSAARPSLTSEEGQATESRDRLNKANQAVMKRNAVEVRDLLSQLERDLSDPEEANDARHRKVMITLDPITRGLNS